MCSSFDNKAGHLAGHLADPGQRSRRHIRAASGFLLFYAALRRYLLRSEPGTFWSSGAAIQLTDWGVILPDARIS